MQILNKLKSEYDSIAIELNGSSKWIAFVLYAILSPMWIISLLALPFCLMTDVAFKDVFGILGIYSGNSFFILIPMWLSLLIYTVCLGKSFKHPFLAFYNSYIVPPVAVLSFFALIFASEGVYPFGEQTIAWCDFTQQGVPYLMNFKSILEGNDGLLFNMANAGGMDAWSLLKTLFLFPFNYLILFVDRGEIMQFSTVLTVLKLAMCSATAMVFFNHCCKKLDRRLAIPLAMMYSFCAYGGMYFQIVTWPDSMYLLPLFFTGLFKLMESGRVLLYSVSLALFVSNISHGFMLILTVILLVGVYTFSLKDSEKLKSFIVSFIGGTTLALLLSCPLWISFFGTFGSSARGENIEANILGSSFITSRYTVFPLILGTIFTLIAYVCFISKKKSALEKAVFACFGLMLIPMVIEPINKMWHAGSYMAFPARFAFILTFLGLIIAGYLLSSRDYNTLDGAPEAEQNTKTFHPYTAILLVALSGIVVYFTASYTFKYFNEMTYYSSTLWGKEKSFLHILKLSIIIGAVYSIAYSLSKKKLLGVKGLAVVLTVLMLGEAFVNTEIYMVAPSNKVDTGSFELYADLGGKIDDDEFYRVKNDSHLFTTYTVSEANFPGAIGYNSTGHYSSLANEDYLYAIKALGYSSMWMKIETYGGTEFTDALLSIKYQLSRVDKNTTVYKNEKYGISELPYYLPLGIYVENDDFELDIYSMTRAEIQQKLFETVTASKEKLIINYEPESFSNCTVIQEDGKHIINGKNGKITYKIDVVGTQTLYFDCFDEFSNSLSEAVNESFSVVTTADKYKKNTNKYPSSSYNKTTGLLKLGEFTDETVTVTLTVNKNISCRSFGVFGLDHAILESGLKNVNGSDITYDGGIAEGSFVSDKDGWLFLSLPYGTNLTYEVNGKAVEAQKAFYGFTAIPVSKGVNNIYIHGKSTLLIFGFIVTGLTLIALAVFIYILRKKKINLKLPLYEKLSALLGKRFENLSAPIATVGHIAAIIAFVAVIALVYIYPLVIILNGQI